MNDTCHLYTDLAWLWPMWGDASTEYAHYCRHLTGLIRQHAKRPAATLLDIGCGGGKNVLNLKRDGLDVVFVENVYDPDPSDEQYETTILYLIRDHGRLRIETDHWTLGTGRTHLNI